MRNSEGQRRTESGRKRTPPVCWGVGGVLGLHLGGSGDPGNRSALPGTCWHPAQLLLLGGKTEPVWFSLGGSPDAFRVLSPGSPTPLVLAVSLRGEEGDCSYFFAFSAPKSPSVQGTWANLG